ncbi:unnamed protein product [Musa banksii]
MVSPSLPPAIPPLSHPSCRGFCPRWSGRSSWLMRNASNIFVILGRRRYRAIAHAIQSMSEKIKAAHPHVQVIRKTGKS